MNNTSQGREGCLITADPKVLIMAPLVDKVFNVFTNTLQDKNYTSFAGSVLVHKMGEGEGGAYFKFWPIRGVLIRKGCLFEEGHYFEDLQ